MHEEFLKERNFIYNDNTDEWERSCVDGNLLIYQLPLVRKWVLSLENKEGVLVLYQSFNITDIDGKLKEIERDIKIRYLLQDD